MHSKPRAASQAIWRSRSIKRSRRSSGQKPEATREHMALLNERYAASNRPAAGVTMDRTKPVQEGVRVKLPAGKTWEDLAIMSPEQIRDQNAFPKGFYPLPHPKHEA